MHRNLILVSVALLSLLTTVWAGTCPDGRASRSVPSTTTKCPQYYQDTCCDPEFVETSCSSYDGCRRLPDQCSYLLDLWYCGLECKPDMPRGTNQLINVCAKFYDNVINACSNVRHCDNKNNTVDCRQTSPGQMHPNCVLTYNPPDSVWTFTFGPFQIQSVNRVDGTGNCFNFASTMTPSIVVIVVLAVFTLLYTLL